MLGNHGFTLDEATNIAVGVVLMLVIGAIGAAVLVNELRNRVAIAASLFVVAGVVAGQLVSTTDCVNDAVGVTRECSFFGRTVRTTPGD